MRIFALIIIQAVLDKSETLISFNMRFPKILLVTIVLSILPICQSTFCELILPNAQSQISRDETNFGLIMIPGEKAGKITGGRFIRPKPDNRINKRR